mgnify:CR=1 FL=1
MELIKQNTQSKILKLLLIVFLGSVILTISAKIKIPFYPVPMTMQTFVVLLLGISFGYKIAIASVALYLFEGIIGLPVFSNSPEKGIGLVYFTGPTMGYLIGFLSACFLASFIKSDDNYYAVNNRCPHAGLSLKGCTIDSQEQTLTCVWHTSSFCYKTGEVKEWLKVSAIERLLGKIFLKGNKQADGMMDMEPTPVNTFMTKVEDDHVWVGIDE